MKDITTKTPKVKAAAIAAVKAEGLRGGITVRRVTRLVWVEYPKTVSGLAHGTDKDGNVYKWWIEARMEAGR